MQKEPTIHQIEKLIAAFRVNGGDDAEISLVAQDIIREFAPERVKPISEIFSKEDHQSIKKIKDFKKDPTRPVVSAAKDAWLNRYIKYPLLFVICFTIFFSVLNLPLLFTKMTPVKEVKYETVKKVVRLATDKSAPLEAGETVPATDTLVIPNISVTAPIIFPASHDEKTIQANLPNGVVQYEGTAKPGETGNTFITGHSSNYWWIKGGYNYIFANLEKLKIGDQAKIYYQGNKFLYQVKNIIVVDPKDTSVLNPTKTATLTLMTCTPPGTSWKRLIVQFDQISPMPKAPIIVETKRQIATELPKSDSNGFLDFVAKLFNF